MQINANYAAGTEYDRNGGEMEWKDLKLKKLRTVQQSTGLATFAVHGSAWKHSQCSATAAALASDQLPAGERRRANSVRDLWYFHLLMSSLM